MAPFGNVEIGGMNIDFIKKTKVLSVDRRNKTSDQKTNYIILENLENGGNIIEHTFSVDNILSIETTFIPRGKNINLPKYELRAKTK